MTTPSQRLGFVLPSGSDLFAMSDWVTNWNLVDANPGIGLYNRETNVVPPGTWGAGQAGRCMVDRGTNLMSAYDTVLNWTNVSSGIIAKGSSSLSLPSQNLVLLDKNILIPNAHYRPLLLHTVTNVKDSNTAAKNIYLTVSGMQSQAGAASYAPVFINHLGIDTWPFSWTVLFTTYYDGFDLQVTGHYGENGYTAPTTNIDFSYWLFSL